VTTLEPDTEGCLLLVAGYAGGALGLAAVTADAARRIMASPALGDFFDVRVADLGPPPVPSANDTNPAGTSAEDVTAADSIAADFIADEFTKPEAIAGRNYFALVIADRSAQAAERLLAVCDVHPVIGRLPLRRRALAIPGGPDPGRELRRYADELLSDFASGNEPGLTPHQLSQLRPAPFRTAESEPAGFKAAEGQLSPGAAVPGLFPPLPLMPPPEPTARGTDLAYLVLVTDKQSASRAERRRGRSAVRWLDRALAADPRAGCQVRVLCSTGHTGHGGPLRAGRLTRRAIRRSSVAGLSLARALGVIRADLQCDLARGTVRSPAVVFYATTMPYADAATVTLHAELAGTAAIIWITPDHLAGSLPQALAGKASRVVDDVQEVAGQFRRRSAAGGTGEAGLSVR
jgi:hypothetical protein